MVPLKIEFVINVTSTLNIEAFADTGWEMEALAGRGFFPLDLLEDGQKRVALIGAGKKRIHGSSAGVLVHITVAVCREDGTLVQQTCLRVFVYVADIGQKKISESLSSFATIFVLCRGCRPLCKCLGL